MTIARCKQNLLQTLEDPSNRVIALSGNWGTGKTHLWKEVRQQSPDPAIKTAASVSLFGVSSITDLKMKMAQELLPKLENDSALKAHVTNALSAAKKVAQSLHRGFAALDDLALLAIPTLLKGKFLIIDDIERKHDKLSIDEILGFIDECVQCYGCRILVVLNDDKLKDKEIWEQFREKVIDQELRLDTSPREAFEIAHGLVTTRWSAQLQEATAACEITNIRILCRIIRVANRLLEGHGELSPNVIDRTVPSIALLSAIYYKGLSDGPTFDYVLDRDFVHAATVRAMKTQLEGGEQSEEDTLHERWDSLLNEVGIRNSGEFEHLVVEVLQTGLLDTQAISSHIERYQMDGQILNVQKKVSEFFDHYNWHPDIAAGALIEELRALIPGVLHIEPPSLSYLIVLADELTGNQTLGQEFIARWTAALNEAFPAGFERSPWPSAKPIHPDIDAVLNAAYSRHSGATTLVQACRKIRETKAWGEAEEILLKNISAAEYEDEIRKASGQDLQNILFPSMMFVRHKTSYEPSFGDVAERFVAACKSIVAADPTSRLATIIVRFFKSRGEEAQL
ncbi:P-loop NTPase fold protein [Pseudomonas sp. W03]|uniref:P-loop NTPase fold protein n=1 Tax=Pseudomonas sp. W03 TaxID=3090666 RepID=UPI003A4D4ADA